MNSLAKSYVRLVDGVNAVTKWLLIALLLACVGESFIEVVLRYFFKVPIGWGNEFCRFTMIWLAFLAAGHAARQGGMIRLEVVFVIFKRMPAWARRGFDVVSAALAVIFYVIAILCTWIVVEKIHGLQYSAALIIPMSFMYSSIMVGCFLLILNTIAALIAPIHKDEVSDTMEMVEEMRSAGIASDGGEGEAR